MNIIKKIILTNVIAVSALGASGIAVSPAFAQTAPPPFDEALLQFRQAREAFMDRRRERQEAAPGDVVAREETLRASRRAFLRRTISFLQRREYDLRQRVIDNRRIYQQHADGIAGDADAHILRLRDFLSRIDGAASDAQYQQLAAELRAESIQHSEIIHKRILLTHLNRFVAVDLERVVFHSNRIGTVIAELKAAGRDVSAVEPLYADAVSKLASIKAQAVELQHTVETQPMTHELFASSRQKIIDMQGQARAVYEIFLVIARKGI